MEYFVKYLGLWMQSCWRVDFLSKILMTPGWVKSDPQKENFLKYFKTWQMIAMIWFEHIPTSNSEKVVFNLQLEVNWRKNVLHEMISV